MTRAAIALGSNLGERAAQLEAAVGALSALPGTRLVAVSSWHETAPVGGPPGQGPYLNGALVLETRLSPRELLDHMQALERRAGRRPGPRDAARVLDLDLLVHGDAGGTRLSRPGLELPHPRMEERLFVLAPLAEVWPDLRLARAGRTVAERLAELRAAAPAAEGAA